MKQDMILILDLGSEENPRLAREIRALGVYSEIHPHDITAEELAALPNVKGIILNGGPNRVVDGVEIDAAKEIYNAPVPVLLADHKGDQPWPEDAAARKEALSNFVFQVCGAQANWNMENFIADQVELIRQQVGDKKVLLALSGGVDSSVVAALLIKAIGKQLTCVHVNHGLLRKGEPEQVIKVFRDEMDANLIYVDAVDRFLDKLAGVSDPERKRKIIGAEFIRVFEEEARKLKKKLVKNQFNFNDFISQIQQIKKMGNLKDLASMLPGMGKMLKNVDIPDDVFKQTEAIISSMTPAEREHPEIINARRRERIAKGSGTTMADVNRLMKQFDDTRKMMKAVAGGGMKMPKMPGGMMRR